MDLVPFTAFNVFLAIAGLGFLFLLVSLLFGELFEFFDHDLDHGPGFFSSRAVGVFVTGFGAFGAIATDYGVPPLGASGAGFAGGLVMASVVYAFGRFLYGQQATSEVRVQDLVGQVARVIVSIPAGGVGQVRCRLGDELIDKIARAADSDAIPENSAVKVEEVLGEVVIVKIVPHASVRG